MKDILLFFIFLSILFILTDRELSMILFVVLLFLFLYFLFKKIVEKNNEIEMVQEIESVNSDEKKEGILLENSSQSEVDCFHTKPILVDEEKESNKKEVKIEKKQPTTQNKSSSVENKNPINKQKDLPKDKKEENIKKQTPLPTIKKKEIQSQKKPTSIGNKNENTSKSNGSINKEKVLPKTKKLTREEKETMFEAYKDFLERNMQSHPEFPKILFETGLFYEEIYNDYFRAACHCFLASTLDKKNKEYEKEYIRLCNLVRIKKGNDWEYKVTLIQNYNDIEIMNDELLDKPKLSKSKQKKKQKQIQKQKANEQSLKNKVKHTQSNKKTSTNENRFENFNEESTLHSLGYRVGKTGLSQSERIKLLRRLITQGKLSKYEIIKTIENNISMSSNNSRRKRAVADWKADLKYVKSNF